MVRDKLTKEDEECIDMIVNPYPFVTEDTLNDIDASVCPDERNLLVCELSVVLSNGAAVLNPKIQGMFPRLIGLLSDKQIYNSSAVMLSDACRHIEDVQNAFKTLGIFNYLDFSEAHYKATVSLVYSLCIENNNNRQYFIENYYDEQRDRNCSLIQSITVPPVPDDSVEPTGI
ncbi:hypothetical protein HK407_01g00800 [Ordospora pajunii]|jgi:hypothetical protein|uniref:uncharacterized protein n=1 Tax=Ordospora pajunii TaxID=3039483 RepID=UPI0029528E68|nr:uncharacterized protein HK407_01g00800 [Ordospora pajunii]KAH9412187.1 hypothetical protein HK407_01g00800 [Ordospora pajunii]